MLSVIYRKLQIFTDLRAGLQGVVVSCRVYEAGLVMADLVHVGKPGSEQPRARDQCDWPRLVHIGGPVLKIATAAPAVYEPMEKRHGCVPFLLEGGSHSHSAANLLLR